MSHTADTTPQNAELQPDTSHCRVERNSEKTAGHALGSSFGSRIMIFMIRIYQRTISPYLPDQCRFEPTCSHYAVEAFRKRGFWAGSLLTAWRLLRCQPFCKGGYDPVPERGFRSHLSRKTSNQ
ncbi:MAG: membrane protein insertion efficiency factor YidD [Lentisphaerae bacterium]|nr:membrane protein insertion efficiency factor YidD [Lentisphaerota bacterium]